MIDFFVDFRKRNGNVELQYELPENLTVIQSSGIEFCLLYVDDLAMFTYLTQFTHMNYSYACSFSLFTLLPAHLQNQVRYLLLDKDDFVNIHAILPIALDLKLPIIINISDYDSLYTSEGHLATRLGIVANLPVMSEPEFVKYILTLSSQYNIPIHITGMSQLSTITLLTQKQSSHITFDLPWYQLLLSQVVYNTLDSAYYLSPSLFDRDEIGTLINYCNRGLIPMLSSHTTFVRLYQKQHSFFDSSFGGYFYSTLRNCIANLESVIPSSQLQRMLVDQPAAFLRVTPSKSYKDVLDVDLPSAVNPLA